jgi:hypothetical protein
MTIENKFPLKLDLQFFAEGDDNTPPTTGEDDLLAAIRSLKDSEDVVDDEDDVDDTDDTDDDDADPEDDIDKSDDDEDNEDDQDEDDNADEPPVDKKKQTKADNAKFAKERREREAKERADAEIERLKTESPEFQLAKMLSDTYGKPADEIMAEMREAQLQKEAQDAKIPVDILRKQRDSDDRANNLEQEIAMLKFQNWQTNIKADGQRLMSEYKMLTQEDMDKAQDYILTVAKNVEMPLEDAVYALHGKKIVESLAKGKVQDELATQSGRKKKTPLAPNNGKPPKASASLSADEKAIAKAFGMSNDEYQKYKI